MKKIILASLFLAVFLVIFLGGRSLTIPIGKEGSAKKIFGPEEARAAAEKFINEKLLPANTKATVKSAVLEGAVYNISLSVQGKDYTSYMTRDGSKFFQTGVNIATYAQDNAAIQAAGTQAQAPAQPSQSASVSKTDKPKVELFVFTYCPYGTQAEKGIIPAVKLLGDKIDFKIRQIGAMHGPHEATEAQRQLCIEKQYPAKLLDYVQAFALDSGVGVCGSDTQCSAPLIDALFNKYGISKSKIDTCMKTDGASLYAAEQANSQSQGVGGSPTLVINGVQSQAGRDSASYLAGICAAFSKAPAECAKQLSSASPAAGFGGSAQ